jgi:hypothetical protein
MTKAEEPRFAARLNYLAGRVTQRWGRLTVGSGGISNVLDGPAR